MNDAYVRSLKWADYIYFALVDPRSMYRLINTSEKGFLPLTCIFPVFAAVVEILAVALLSVQSPFFFAKVSYGWILLSLLNCIGVLLFSLLLDMELQFTGKPGNIKKIITLVNIAQFPMLFLLPAVSIFTVLNFAALFFFVLFALALSAWCAFIIITGISEMYALPFAKALLYYILPYAVFFAVMLFINVSGAALIISGISNI